MITVKETVEEALDYLEANGYNVDSARNMNPRNERSYFEKKDDQGRRIAAAQIDKFGSQWLVNIKS